MNRAVVVLDETGSMSGQEERVVTSMNEYVAGLPEDAMVTVFKFDSEHWTEFFDGEKKRWKPMVESDYSPGAMTPLYDAIGKAVKHAEGNAKDGDKVLLMIDTDGYENASKEFEHAQIVKMVDKYKGKGWQFLFMSSGIDQKQADAVGAVGTAMGMTNFSADHDSRVANYTVASTATASYFTGPGGAGAVPKSDKTVVKRNPFFKAADGKTTASSGR